MNTIIIGLIVALCIAAICILVLGGIIYGTKASKVVVCKYCECIMSIDGPKNALVADVIETGVCDECKKNLN